MLLEVIKLYQNAKDNVAINEKFIKMYNLYIIKD